MQPFQLLLMVRSALMSGWDPIGVKDVPQAHDEYDRYAIEVTSMLMKERTSSEIGNYLHRIATEWMGLNTELSRSASVASTLVEIYTSSRNRKGSN